jgi:predicted nuclease of predicted toxin-antitoxin system
MKLLVDMNLAPSLCVLLRNDGQECVHWTEAGDPRASDADIMSWARDRGFVVITHDLDFTSLLAATQARGPSVVLLRTKTLTALHLHELLKRVLRSFGEPLSKGALISVDESRARIRVLPV